MRWQAIFGLEISMLGEKKSRDLRLYGLSEQRARPLPQDFGELTRSKGRERRLSH
jgi:hypothetical protein